MEHICPRCGRHLTGINKSTRAVVCGNCGEVVRIDPHEKGNMLEKLSPDQKEGLTKRSPEIILKDGGVGWVGKNGGKK